MSGVPDLGTSAMTPMNSVSLYDLKSISNHFLHAARRQGKSTATPLAFMGAITVVLGAKLLWDAYLKNDIPLDDQRSR